MGIFHPTLQCHGASCCLPHQALQLVTLMGWHLGVGVQGKPVDTGAARTRACGTSIGKIRPLFPPSRSRLPLVPAPRPPALTHAWPALVAAGRPFSTAGGVHPVAHALPPAVPPARWRGSSGALAQP